MLLLAVAIFIVVNRSASQTIRANTLGSITNAAGTVANPIDKLTSAQIALTAAQMTGLPELTAVHNQADSDSLLLSEVPNDSTALSKPQIVATAEKSRRDIIHYTTQPGDTVTSLSTKFNVTPSSIRWSNNIWGDSLAAGLHLVIPPVNGIVYTVKAGDTPASLASRFSADENTIINYNDAEISGLTPGEQILIPNGTLYSPSYYYTSSGFAWGSSALYGFNGYDFGECTWYVATQIPVPANWGNAATWAAGARASGWTVRSTPSVGAIAQTPYAAGGLGHVAIVVGVSNDGSQIEIKDMNGLAGWDAVGEGWVSTATYQNFITR